MTWLGQAVNNWSESSDRKLPVKMEGDLANQEKPVYKKIVEYKKKISLVEGKRRAMYNKFEQVNTDFWLVDTNKTIPWLVDTDNTDLWLVDWNKTIPWLVDAI